MPVSLLLSHIAENIYGIIYGMGVSAFRNKIVFSLPVILLMIGAGCGRSQKAPGVYIDSARHMRIFELADSDAVVVVNGEKMTKRDFNALLVLRDRIWRMQVEKPFDATQEEMDAFALEAGPSLVMELIHHALFRQYAAKLGAVPSTEAVSKAEKQFLAAVKRGRQTLAAVADQVGGDAAEIVRKIPYVDAQDALLRQSITTNDLDFVSEEELAARVRFVERFDANAEAMNAKARERLMKARAEILSGGDMVRIAREIPDAVNPELAKEWGTFEIQELASDEDLYKWLPSAKVGDISEPVDVEDGLAIVKLVAKGKGEAPQGVEPPDNFTLVRCTVKACEKMRYQDRAEMTAQLLLWKRQEAQVELGQKLFSEAVIEYPNGTNLFDVVTMAQGADIGSEEEGGKQR